MPRTRAQGYKPGCDWDAFGTLKQAVNIPVIANGDIVSLQDTRQVMDTYGVDGVMMGRGCQGAPWLVGDIDVALKTGQPIVERPLPERLNFAIEHAKLHCDYRGMDVGIREMRKHLAWYAVGFPGASGYRNRLTSVSSIEDIEQIFDEILTQQHLPVAV